ncbi:MAG TPA: cell division protein ZapA [Gemmatimonadetes bacterium]|jgi:cell division protein ZapA|nr:cell division protein ZapA [Gemmatimonadota bacterium]HIC16248.1 cell division protein ZapA [Gemmatimonadota bacterium]
MTPQKIAVTVRIAGEEYTIRADTEPEHTKRCAKMVDDRIHEINVQTGLVDGDKAAILAALSIADEYFQARKELDEFRGVIAARAEKLMRRIEEDMPDLRPS